MKLYNAAKKKKKICFVQDINRQLLYLVTLSSFCYQLLVTRDIYGAKKHPGRKVWSKWRFFFICIQERRKGFLFNSL